VVSPDGRRVYVANGAAGVVSIVDPEAGREVGTIPVGRRPWGVDLSDDGRWLVVANGVSGSVSVIDVREARVVRDIPVGRLPWGVAIGP
jgi:YVTN family beta-propeller protein